MERTKTELTQAGNFKPLFMFLYDQLINAANKICQKIIEALSALLLN
jgi:hypothetical protein